MNIGCLISIPILVGLLAGAAYAYNMPVEQWRTFFHVAEGVVGISAVLYALHFTFGRGVSKSESEDDDIQSTLDGFVSDREPLLWELHRMGEGDTPRHWQLWTQVENSEKQEERFRSEIEVGYDLKYRYKTGTSYK